MRKLTAITLLLFLATQFLAGCAKYQPLPPGTKVDISDSSAAILALQEVTVPPVDERVDPTAEYRIGPGDVLAVTVPGLVERPAGEATRGEGQGPSGYRVYTSGKVLLPLVGAVPVAGLTVEQTQARLVEAFSAYIKQPVVTVEILQFQSQPLYLLGRFNKPGLVYLDRPTSLIHGIALGGGLPEGANLRGARVLRDGKVLPVDIYQLFQSNDQRQNISLHQGDTIYVPGNEAQRVFVFGVAQGVVPMTDGRLNLLQALSAAGLNGKPYARDEVRIIRTLSPTRGQLMIVDLGQMMEGKALPMPLQDGDIVYVPKTRLGGWNEAISEILPTFQLMGALISPFLWAEALKDDN